METVHKVIHTLCGKLENGAIFSMFWENDVDTI
jgi:hypothetical protein